LARPRPDYWVAIHETSFAYSSGHAMFAVLVYGLGSWYVARSRWPAHVRIPLGAALAAWACGVIWSRLALGAHFVTDLVGGILLATVVLALAAATGALTQATDCLPWHRKDDGPHIDARTT